MENEFLEEQFEMMDIPEIKTKQVVITGKFNCQSFPLGRYEKTTVINEEGIEETKEMFIPLPHLIEITEEELSQIDPINGTKCFDLENNCVVDYDNTEDLKRQHLEELRAMREPLLIAFDKYKSNVNYGVEFETAEQRDEIVLWYNSILNLEGTAFEIIPERIRYYL